MGNWLYKMFLEATEIDVQKFVALHGLHGLLASFENWLQDWGMDSDKIERNFREGKSE